MQTVSHTFRTVSYELFMIICCVVTLWVIYDADEVKKKTKKKQGLGTKTK